MSDDAMERFLNGETNELPPGWDIAPMYEKCPQCGCDLTQHYMDSENCKHKTKEIKKEVIMIDMKVTERERSSVVFERTHSVSTHAPLWLYFLAKKFGTRQSIIYASIEWEVRQFFGQQYLIIR